jgi:uncharacterized protein (TIGR02328 family)
MRLWHEELIPKLPRQQLLGQHRECCALRGNGWGKKHSTVNYVFKHSYIQLYFYHMIVMGEMKNRGYNPNEKWTESNYRGKKCKEYDLFEAGFELLDSKNLFDKTLNIYPEHDGEYYQECIENLKKKGIEIK